MSNCALNTLCHKESLEGGPKCRLTGSNAELFIQNKLNLRHRNRQTEQKTGHRLNTKYIVEGMTCRWRDEDMVERLR